MVTTSFKDEADIFVTPPKFVGIRYSVDNYVWLFNRMPFFKYMLNTGKVTVLVVIFQLFTNSMGGYAFARFRFKGREGLFIFYQFFLPIKMLPTTDEEEQRYYHYIDNFARMGGDMVTIGYAVSFVF